MESESIQVWDAWVEGAFALAMVSQSRNLTHNGYGKRIHCHLGGHGTTKVSAYAFRMAYELS